MGNSHYKHLNEKQIFTSTKLELDIADLETKLLNLDVQIDDVKSSIERSYDKKIDKVNNLKSLESEIGEHLNTSRLDFLLKADSSRQSLLAELDKNGLDFNNSQTKLLLFNESNKFLDAQTFCEIVENRSNFSNRSTLEKRLKFMHFNFRLQSIDVDVKLNAYPNDTHVHVIESNQCLLFYFSNSLLLQLRDINSGRVQFRVFLEDLLKNNANNKVEFDEIFLLQFGKIRFRTNQNRIVCLNQIYNESILFVFDKNLNELRREMFKFKYELVSINESNEILVRSYQNEQYYVIDEHLHKCELLAKHQEEFFVKNEQVLTLSSNEIFVYTSNTFILKIYNRHTLDLIGLIKLTPNLLPHQIQIDSKQKRVLVKLNDKLLLYNSNGQLIIERKLSILKNFSSIFYLDSYEQVLLVNKNKNEILFIWDFSVKSNLNNTGCFIFSLFFKVNSHFIFDSNF